MIHVCDSIMGSGKSSAAITYMNERPDKRFIYITPYLEEAKRIKNSCPGLRFAEPSNKIAKYQFSKVKHTEALIRDGRNVASTHQAFKEYSLEMLEQIREKEYILIVDECVDAIEKTSIHPADIKLLEDSGYIECKNGMYRPTDKIYEGTKFADEFSTLRSRSLVMQSDEGEDGLGLYYWMLSPDLITSFREAFVLTYMFESHGLCRLFEMCGISYDTINVTRSPDGAYRFDSSELFLPDYVGELKSRIHILDNDKMNAIGEDRFDISLNWFTREKERVPQLKKNLENYFGHIVKDSAPGERMWSTYKSVVQKLKGVGYSRAFVPFNARATNEYGNRTCLAYPINIFMGFGEKRFWNERGVGPNEDLYALSVMVQWIWRSAIRNGSDIDLYLPSSRMRDMLLSWMADPIHPELAVTRTVLFEELKDGDRVRLNVHRIRERMDGEMSASFYTFLRKNRDSVFTVNATGCADSYLSLKEAPKWVFRKEDLTRVSE